MIWQINIFRIFFLLRNMYLFRKFEQNNCILCNLASFYLNEISDFNVLHSISWNSTQIYMSQYGLANCTYSIYDTMLSVHSKNLLYVCTDQWLKCHSNESIRKKHADSKTCMCMRQPPETPAPTHISDKA